MLGTRALDRLPRLWRHLEEFSKELGVVEQVSPIYDKHTVLDLRDINVVWSVPSHRQKTPTTHLQIKLIHSELFVKLVRAILRSISSSLQSHDRDCYGTDFADTDGAM